MKQIIYLDQNAYSGLLKHYCLLLRSQLLLLPNFYQLVKTISFEQLKQIFDEIPLWKLLLMMVIGLVSVTRC